MSRRDTPLAAVRRHDPDLIVAPMLKTAVPREVWSAYTCLIVHPGPLGDRGPSSVDWAIHLGETRWGVTVLQANDEMDAGDVWAAADCPVPAVGKSDLYRNEIADAAMRRRPVGRRPLRRPAPTGRSRSTPFRRREARPPRPPLRQDLRRIDWSADPTETVVRKLRAADSQPGVRDELLGGTWFLHGGHPEDTLTRRAGRAARHPLRRHLPRDGRRRGMDPRTAAAAPRRGSPAPSSCPRPSRWATGCRRCPRSPPLWTPGHGPRTWTDIRYQRGRPGRIPGLLLPRRRDEHRPLPAAARRLPPRLLPADLASWSSAAAGTSSPTAST